MKYLVCGDAILDHYLYGNIDRQSPEDPKISVLDVESEEFRLGGCLNVAANLKSISKEQVSVSSIIENESSTLLKNKDVDRRFCEHVSYGREAIKKTRIIDLKDKKQIIRIDNIKRYSENLIKNFEFMFGSLELNEFDCIVVSDYQKGIIGDIIIKRLESYSNPVFVDTKKNDLSVWKNINNCIIKINDKEFGLSKNYDIPKNLIVTRGHLGASLYNNGIFTDNCFVNNIRNGDITGAGDVFLAAFVAKYMKCKDMKLSMEFANKAAGESVKHFGTVVVDVPLE